MHSLGSMLPSGRGQEVDASWPISKGHVGAAGGVELTGVTFRIITHNCNTAADRDACRVNFPFSSVVFDQPGAGAADKLGKVVQTLRYLK